MKKIQYEIVGCFDYSSETTRKTVTGYKAFEMFGLEFAVRLDAQVNSNKYWVVDELSTGKCVKYAHAPNTRKQAVQEALELLNKVGEERTLLAVQGQKVRVQV